MIHNIPQPVLERELTDNVAQDPNIVLLKGFSIHGIEQVYTKSPRQYTSTLEPADQLLQSLRQTIKF
jgi:hypothetical protein